MRFLKFLFWGLAALVLFILVHRNWSDVTLTLWGGLVMDVKLPLLLIAVFALGALVAVAAGALRRRRRREEARQAAIAARHGAGDVAPTPTTDIPAHADEEDPF